MSLFDGMACGMLAMQKAGIEVKRYVAFEINKYAVQTASHNFPQIEQRGDVFCADFTEFSGFDFLIGGSPCTYWSIAQTKNRETVASGMGWELFSQYVRALHEAKPKFFIYENNKSMAKAIRASIDEAFGFEAICINSALVSAQNRQRLYWVGRRNEDGTYSKVTIEQPEDKGILLKDILEGCAEPVCVAERGQYVAGVVEQHYEARTDGKTNVLTTVVKDNNVCEPVCMRYERSDEAKAVRKQYEAGEIHHGYHELHELHPRTDGKTNTLSTVLKDNPICEPVRVGTYPNNSKNPDHDTQQYRVYSVEGKTVTLCGNGGGMGVKTGLYAIPCEWDKKGNVTKAVSTSDGKTYPVYPVENGIITINGKQYPIKLIDGVYIIRKLTVLECMRLQTVPEWYEWPVSDTQARKMLGNRFTVNVIAHLIKCTKTE